MSKRDLVVAYRCRDFVFDAEDCWPLSVSKPTEVCLLRANGTQVLHGGPVSAENETLAAFLLMSLWKLCDEGELSHPMAIGSQLPFRIFGFDPAYLLQAAMLDYYAGTRSMLRLPVVLWRTNPSLVDLESVLTANVAKEGLDARQRKQICRYLGYEDDGDTPEFSSVVKEAEAVLHVVDRLGLL